jgi:hypothetical protein
MHVLMAQLNAQVQDIKHVQPANGKIVAQMQILMELMHNAVTVYVTMPLVFMIQQEHQQKMLVQMA